MASKPGRRSSPPALVLELGGTLAAPRGRSPTLSNTPPSPAPTALQDPASPQRSMYPQPPALSLSDLPAAIRQQAGLIARFAPGAAEGFLYCADWVELCLTAHLDERLPLAQAAKESGWSYEGLRKQLAERPELNAGEPGAPMIRRSDLPKFGAPRGPRGAYGPRKAKGKSPASPTPQAAPEAQAAASVAGAGIDGATTPEESLESVDAGGPVAPAQAEDAIPFEDHTPDDATSPRRVRRENCRRPGTRRDRRRSADRRFEEILTLAAVG